MSAGTTPWSVKGIDSKAREVAKDLARRSGMTLGEWLNHMILQGEDVAAVIDNERQRTQGQNQGQRTRVPERAYAEDAYAEEADFEDYPPARAPRSAARGYESARRDARPEPRFEPTRRPAPFSSGAQRAAPQAPVRPAYSQRSEPYYDDAPGADLGRVARVLETLGSRLETSETRSASAVRGVSHAVESLLTRLERSESSLAETLSETEERLHGQTREVLDTVHTSNVRLSRAEEEQQAIADRLESAERLVDAQAERLEGLSGHLREERERVARLEAALKNTNVTETVQAVEGALGKLANQLYENDARTRESFKDVRGDMVGLSHRLSQMELRDPEGAAQKAIDKVVTRLAERLEAAESKTSTAIRSLEQAFASLDSRILRAEERGDVSDPESVQSLSRLADDLSRRVEESRFEIIRALEASTQQSLDQTVTTINARLEAVEARSARAVETLGHDVLKIADNLNRRMTGVEQTSEEAVTRVGADVRRLADSVDTRMGRAETAHAQALERLGGEIARISERLTIKISETERRTSQVLQGVGEELDTRHQRVNTDIAERIRQSEERTQKLLEEARAKIDSKLSQAKTQSLLGDVDKPKPRADDLPSPFGPTALQQKPFAAFEHGFDEDAEPEAGPEAPELTAPEIKASEIKRGPEVEDLDLTGRLLGPITDFGPEPDFTPQTAKPEFDPFDDADDAETELIMQAPLGQPKKAFDPFDDDMDTDPFADVDASRKVSPAARTEPRLSAEVEDDLLEAPMGAIDPEAPAPYEEARISMSTRDALAAARAAVRASTEGSGNDKKALGGLKLGLSRTKDAQAKPAKGGGNTMMRALKASSVAVVVTAVGVGTYFFFREDTTAPKKPVNLAAAAITEPSADAPRDAARLKAMYDAATLALEANDPKAVETMKSVALLGYAPAQFQMSRLYEGERGLIDANKTEAFLWAERAAQGGHGSAMYNLGLMFYNGEGTPQDLTAASGWFRKAADRGIRDSYYNLGAMYMQGEGVPMNLTEAFAWFTIASKAGDSSALSTLNALKPQLTTQQIAAAEAQAARFKPVEASKAAPLAAR